MLLSSQEMNKRMRLQHPSCGNEVAGGYNVSGAPSALGLSLPFGFDNYAAFC
jgi:hypothetical protein